MKPLLGPSRCSRARSCASRSPSSTGSAAMRISESLRRKRRIEDETDMSEAPGSPPGAFLPRQPAAPSPPASHSAPSPSRQRHAGAHADRSSGMRAADAIPRPPPPAHDKCVWSRERGRGGMSEKLRHRKLGAVAENHAHASGCNSTRLQLPKGRRKGRPLPVVRQASNAATASSAALFQWRQQRHPCRPALPF